MSERMEGQLARSLGSVNAPEALGVRLGFAPARRRQFPRLALVAAAAIVLLVAGAYADSGAADRTRARLASNDPVVVAAWMRHQAEADTPLRCAASVGTHVQLKEKAAAPDAGCYLCHSL